MNRKQFNEWLQANDGCSEAVKWCDQHPDLSPHELIAICPRGDWILWLYAKSGYAPELLAPVAYRAATRAIGYAADALDSAGVEHELRGIVINKESAVAGDEAAANAVVAARSAAYAEYSAASAAAFATAYAASAAKRADASKASAALAARAAADAAAEHKLCADDCRAMLPVWEVGE